MAMMISKFHKIIQSKVVWTAFAILICVAFVGIYTGGSKSQKAAMRSQQEAQVAGRLFGEDISRAEFSQAYRNTYVLYSLNFGKLLQVNEEVDGILRKAAWQRIATIKKAQQLGLSVSNDEIIQMIQRQRVFANQQTGQFDKNIYDAFVSNFLPRVNMSPKGFESMFAEQVLISKASRIPTQGALVTEDEILKAFHYYTDTLTVEYASLPRSLAKAPAVTEEDAKAYFEANPEQFRMPEKAMVDYVEFAVADYTNNVEVTDEMVSQYYEGNKQRYIKDPEADTQEYIPLEEVKGDIVKDITMAMGRRNAADEADKLVASLADETLTFEKAATDAGLKVVNNTPAFSLTDTVKGIDPTAPFQRAALNLEKDATHYYSDPVVGRDKVYVLSLTKKLESFLPAFDIVKDEAMESARIAAAETAYVEKAEAIHSELEAAIASGTAFEDAASKYKLKLKTTEPFSIATELEDEFGQQIKAGTISVEAGKLTDLIPTMDEYLVAFVAEKVPGDEATTLPIMREELAASLRNEKANQLMSEWQDALLVEAGFEDLSKRTTDDDNS